MSRWLVAYLFLQVFLKSSPLREALKKHRIEFYIHIMSINTKTNNRALLAFILAPWISPIIMTLSQVFLTGNFPSRFNFSLDVMPAVITSYVSLLLIGPPIVRMLDRIKKLNILMLFVCGAISGIVVFALFAALLALALGSYSAFRIKLPIFIMGSLLGGSVAIAFGFIAGISFFGKKIN